jgi:phage head maturation protease
MGGEIPTILTQVSQLLESGEDVKTIQEHDLTGVESIPKVDLLKETSGLYTRTRWPNTIVMPKGKVWVGQ